MRFQVRCHPSDCCRSTPADLFVPSNKDGDATETGAPPPSLQILCLRKKQVRMSGVAQPSFFPATKIVFLPGKIGSPPRDAMPAVEGSRDTARNARLQMLRPSIPTDMFFLLTQSVKQALSKSVYFPVKSAILLSRYEV